MRFVTLSSLINPLLLTVSALSFSQAVLPGHGLTLQVPFYVEGQLQDRPTTLETTSGASLTIKVTDPELDNNDPQQETYLYTIQYQDPDTFEWHNLCNPAPDGSTKVIPLQGEWDDTGAYVANDEITFACTSGVIAKCALWGYRPWQTEQGTSLRDYHQACTRMARADYCGNGISYTQDGTLINLYDRLGIQTPGDTDAESDNDSLIFEAAWGPNGAELIHHTRFPDGWQQIWQDCPEQLQIYNGDLFDTTDIMQQATTALLFNDSHIRDNQAF